MLISSSLGVLILCVLSHSVVTDSLQPPGLQPARLLCPWDSPGKNTGVGRHPLFQGIFLTQGWNLNPGLLLCRWILDPLSHQESPIVICVPWGGTRVLPKGCTTGSWMFLPWFCIPSQISSWEVTEAEQKGSPRPGTPPGPACFQFLKVQLWSSSLWAFLQLPCHRYWLSHRFLSWNVTVCMYFVCVHVALFSLTRSLRVVNKVFISISAAFSLVSITQRQYMFVKLAWWNRLALSCKNIDGFKLETDLPHQEWSCHVLIYCLNKLNLSRSIQAQMKKLKIIILLCRSNHKFHFGTCSFNILQVSFWTNIYKL